MSDYSEIFGREPEAWRGPLGALRLTLTGAPSEVDVARAQSEVETLVKVLNASTSAELGGSKDTAVLVQVRRYLERFNPGGTSGQDAMAQALQNILEGEQVAWAQSDDEGAGR